MPMSSSKYIMNTGCRIDFEGKMGITPGLYRFTSINGDRDFKVSGGKGHDLCLVNMKDESLFIKEITH